MKGLVAFLYSLHALLHSNHQKTFVLGNTSADMDSVVSAITLSYSLHKQYPNRIFIPLINCSRKEITYRMDIVWLLEEYKIPLDSLIFSDKLASIKRRDKIILVDHNKIDFPDLEPNVTSIVDHHIWVNANRPHIKDITIRFPRASCLGIIIEEYVFKNSLEGEFDPGFLSATILQDSGNFFPAKKDLKWVGKDKQIVETLNKDRKIDMTAIFTRINAEKTDVEKNLALGLVGLLNKDKKTFHYAYKNKEITNSYSVFHISIDDFLSKYTFEALVEQVKGAEIALFQFPISNLEQIVVVYTQSVDLMDTVVNGLQAEFHQEKKTKIRNDIFRIRLEGSYLSRKTIEPAIKEAVEN